MSPSTDGSEWSPYGTRDASRKLGGCVRQRTSGSVRSWGCVSHVHSSHVLSGIRTVVHGDDFMSGGPRHQLKWAGRSPGQTLRVEAHSDGSVQRAAWEKKLQEKFREARRRFVVALPVGASAKKRAEDSQGDAIHLQGRGERIEKALEQGAGEPGNLTFASFSRRIEW